MAEDMNANVTDTQVSEPVADTQATTEPTAAAPAQQETQPTQPQALETTLGGVTYGEFTMPEGFDQPNEAFLEIAKELNIPQAGVQKMVDFYTQTLIPQLIQEQQSFVDNQNNEWRDACERELGRAGVDMAKSAYQQFATPELTEMLNQTGLGSHPALVRMFAEIGKQLGEGTLIKGGAAAGQKRQADILFG